MSDKTGRDGRDQQSGRSHWHSLDSFSSPELSQNKVRWKQGHNAGLLGAKTEIPAK